MGELFAHPRLRDVVMDRVPLEEPEASRFGLRSGDLLFARQSLVLAGAGKCSIFLGDPEPVTFESHVIRVRLDPTIADPFFYFYLFLSRAGRSVMESIVEQGAGASGIRASDLARLLVPHPALDEQRRIAGILGALDDKIELNHQLAERLDDAARAIFQGWFIENPAAAVWPVASLADVFEVNPSRPLPRTAPAPYLDMANMPTRGPSALGVAMRIPGSGARFENGDTLLARITPCLENGKTALVDFLPPGDHGWGSTEYIVLRPREPLPEPFAYCLARQPEFVTYAVARMNGSSGRQRVSAAAISEFEIRTPPPELATRFGNVVRPMFDRIAVARRESRTLVALRDALLPRLLSGGASLPSAEGR